MTHYRVEWLEDALEELAALWITTRSRAFTEASNRIEKILSSHLAPTLGTPFGNDEGLRMIDEPPLRIIFTVNQSKQLVEVVAAWKSPSK